MQNGQQGPEQTFLNTHHKDILDASEHGDEIDGLDVRISVLEEKNETLEEKNETLEKQFKRLMEENQQLKAALAGRGIEQSKEEHLCSTASTQQVFKTALDETAIDVIFFSCGGMDMRRKKCIAV